MTRTRSSFTDEFKRETVKLVRQPGAIVTHIARDLGIEASVLRRWVNQECEGALDMRPNRPIRSKAATEVERLQREEARSDVFDYIESFYNPVRKHSKLDFLSPVQFEEGLKG